MQSVPSLKPLPGARRASVARKHCFRLDLSKPRETSSVVGSERARGLHNRPADDFLKSFFGINNLVVHGRLIQASPRPVLHPMRPDLHPCIHESANVITA